MNINKAIKILERYDTCYQKIYNDKKNRKKRILHWLFNPYFFFLECAYRRKIWWKYIIPAIIQNDNIFHYLDDNDFELKDGLFHKIELTSDKEYYDVGDPVVIKERVKKDFITIFINLFKDNLSFDIENYVTLIVDVNTKYVEDHHEYYKSQVYEVFLQSCRHEFHLIAKHRFIAWIISFVSLLLLTAGAITLLHIC
jgi:hypothetical protein